MAKSDTQSNRPNRRNSKTLLMPMQEVEKLLQERQVSMTAQRLAVCQLVLGTPQHFTAEQLYERASQKLGKISLATVYNTLKTLVEVGLLLEFRFPYSDKLIYDSRTDHHFHLFDEQTQTVHDLDSKQVKISLSLPKNFKMNNLHVFIKGSLKQPSKGA